MWQKGRTSGAASISFLAALLLCAGCAAQYKLLNSVSEVPRLARLEESSRQMAGTTMRVRGGSVGGRPIHLAMERTGRLDADRTLVLVHGLLSDRATWRFVAGALGRDNTLLMIDLPGCGESDHPDPKEGESEAYSPSSMALSVLEALRDHVERHGIPRRMTLVGHSLGGAVLLRMMGDESLKRRYAEVLEPVDGVVLISPLDFALEKAHPKFVAIESLGGFKIGIAAWLRILKNRVARATLEGVTDPNQALKEEAERQIRIIRQRESRRAVQAMIRQAVPYDPDSKRPLWDEIDRLVQDYRNVSVPTLILWGEHDETLPASMGYKLRAQLPDARLRILPRTKHSPQLERPSLTARLVRDFVADDPAGWAPVARVELPGKPVEGATAVAGVAAGLP